MSYKNDIPVIWIHSYSNYPLFQHLSIQIDIGLLIGNSQVIFEKSESSSLTLVGESHHTLVS